MNNHDLLEGHLIGLEFAFERVDDNLWVVHNPEGAHFDVAVYITGNIVNFRLKVFDLPPEPTVALLRYLLELNASDMVHGAYAIDNNDVVVEGSLELENLDRNEVQAMLDSFAIAVSTHRHSIGHFIS